MAQAKPRAKPKPKAETTAPAVETPRRWTYEDYCAIPDDGLRYEVIRGELYVAPAPLTIHQRIVLALAYVLVGFVRRAGIGEVMVSPVDVRLLPESTVQPDLIFIRKDRLGIIRSGYVDGAPDLVVEVLSDSTAARDRSAKRDLYAENGVPFYWIFAPRTHSIEEYRLSEGQYELVQRREGDEDFAPVAFPGLTFSLTELRPPPPVA